MNDIALKYRLLDKNSRKEINDFIDFLLSKRKIKKARVNTEYKKRILSVSTWTDKDIEEFENNKSNLNNLSIPEW